MADPLNGIKISLLIGHVLFSANLLQNRFNSLAASVNNSAAAFFENAGLGLCDFLHGIAQNTGVVQTHVGDDGHFRHTDGVGGIQFATHANFHNHNIALLPLKMLHGNAPHQLKLRGHILHGLCQRLSKSGDLRQVVVFDLLAVYLDSLVEAVQVRRSIQAHFVACFSQNRGGHGSGRAFAVGAANVDIFQFLFRTTHTAQ